MTFVAKLASWNFRVKEALVEVDVYTSEKLPPPKKNVGIATEIASICVFVPKLYFRFGVQFLLPVCI